MAKASEVVAKAKSQLGIKESPANSNRVKYWDYYKQRTGVNYNGQPWCAAFVSWVMWQCGVWNTNKDEGYLRYCPSLVNKAKADGTWLGRTSNPKPGDIVLFGNRGTACHVGIVECKVSNTRVKTIEGNTSAGSNANGGQVQNRTRDFGSIGSSWYILGFMRPKYDAELGNTTSSSTVNKQPSDVAAYDKTPDDVKEVQTYMNNVYKSSLDVDGEFGPKTKAAIVKQVQKNIGATITGKFDTVTKNKWGNTLIKNGSNGSLTRLCQMMLICKNYSVGSYGADGDCGSATVSAVKKYQKANNLEVDGIIGRDTASKLFA